MGGLGEGLGLGAGVGGLGGSVALGDAGRVEETIDAHTRARDLFQAAGDRHREGMAWNNLGVALRQAGRAGEAIEAYGKDLEICREFEDWYGTG